MPTLIMSLILGVFLLVLVSSMFPSTHANNQIPLFLIGLLFLSGIWVGIEIELISTDHPATVNVSNESTSKEGQ